MTERERLIELLKESEKKVSEMLSQPLELEEWLGVYADYLLANGVIVPPCKVGDKVYFIHRGKIELLVVEDISYSLRYKSFTLKLKDDINNPLNVDYNHFIGYKLFLTKEEAEKALESDKV